MAEEEKKQASEEEVKEAKAEEKEAPKEAPEEVKEKELKEEVKEEKKEELVEKKPEAPKEPEAPKAAPKEKPVKIKVPVKFKKIVEEIENLKVVDLAELVKILEKKFGVSAVPAAVAPVAAKEAPEVEAKKFFNISLTQVGSKKIEVIKAVRDITQRGLKESKDLVDKVAEGAQIIKENAKKEEAEEIKKKLEEAGAKVELK